MSVESDIQTLAPAAAEPVSRWSAILPCLA
jgi:hypothetical protein